MPRSRPRHRRSAPRSRPSPSCRTAADRPRRAPSSRRVLPSASASGTVVRREGARRRGSPAGARRRVIMASPVRRRRRRRARRSMGFRLAGNAVHDGWCDAGSRSPLRSRRSGRAAKRQYHRQAIVAAAIACTSPKPQCSRDDERHLSRGVEPVERIVLHGLREVERQERERQHARGATDQVDESPGEQRPGAAARVTGMSQRIERPTRSTWGRGFRTDDRLVREVGDVVTRTPAHACIVASITMGTDRASCVFTRRPARAPASAARSERLLEGNQVAASAPPRARPPSRARSLPERSSGVIRSDRAPVTNIVAMPISRRRSVRSPRPREMDLIAL